MIVCCLPASTRNQIVLTVNFMYYYSTIVYGVIVGRRVIMYIKYNDKINVICTTKCQFIIVAQVKVNLQNVFLNIFLMMLSG